MADSPFPDVRWGSETTVLRRPAEAFASTKAGSWLIREAAGLDRRVLERTGGRFTLLGPIGAPVVLLRTTGRKSGLIRTSPLLYYREDPRIYVVGSNFGQDKHPAWSGNLLAEPQASVLMGGREIPVTATLLDEPERSRIFRAFEEMVSVYGVYGNRTDRAIRVFALSAET
ncbi:nitroreductase family deazaflavin-dependent oxidoreductase [Rhodococcus triatomae]|uniref:Deazaflavin-dependent oxidoreductase, nitroreductase family n=1 Tax=Rhodococcus triatomae TaxID=300028 RepID=A0A1G8NIY7_9NOCA|nr:nitroreductase/quinone reductase family protein [Rhodococcus triatomae]QNG20004.1 nitroreductase family deazaflavin-dependent oxidoreductase [Rhodococcus triatomae]QNG24080.1 nitroreductase family deazaflavin-dependent oxidoreductase [Rhodococcus triatomae]SDI79470.1 deazaflavin-dependent oxidoreductase, nitroreductase family [Rhodococcus triatomae]